MKRLLLGLLGISAASIIKGLRFGFREFRYASGSTTWNVLPFESRKLRSIPVAEVESLINGKAPLISLHVQPYETGMLPINEASALLCILVDEKPSIVLEIGTFKGHTSRLMAINCPTAIIHTLDLPLDFNASVDHETAHVKDDFHLIASRVPGEEFRGKPEAERIRQHFADSATWDFQPVSGATFFFIDGSHTYSYVKSDSENCLKLCPGKGVFLWHDCDSLHPGVVQFLVEWRQQGRNIVRIAGTNMAFWRKD